MGGHRILFFATNSFLKRNGIDFLHNPYIIQYNWGKKGKIYAMFEGP